MNIWLRQAAELNKDQTAIIYEGESLTYKSLQEKVHAYAARLPKLKRVGVYVDNSLNSAVLIHSLIERHIEIVFINTRLFPSEINRQLKDVDVDTVITTVDESKLDDLDARVLTFESVYNNEKVNYKNKLPKDDDILSIMFTSGTTGCPKAVTQSYLNHYASHKNAARHLDYDSMSTWLMVNPIFHISGFSILMRAVISQCTLIIHNKFDTKKVLKDLENYNVTHTSFVPVMLSRIMNDKDIKKTDLSHLKAVLMGGANTTPHLLKQALENNFPVFNSFGMTETCSQTVVVSYKEDALLTGAVGKMNKNIKINSKGELLVKGDNVTKGYLNAPLQKEDGFFNTGDIAKTTDGYIYILDRRDDLIISGGENIYPKEIEDVVLKHTHLEHCVVVKKEDDTWGQVPVLLIDEAIDEEKLHEIFNESIARFKHPKEIIVVEKIIYTPTGKISRRLNREAYIE